MTETSTHIAFGRIDAQGTVYVRTAAGERVVGSWQAGSVEDGLAHYARRYEDLRTEANLVASRFDAGTSDPMHTLASAQRLRASLTEANVVGDLDALAQILDTVIEKAQTGAENLKQARLKAREEAIARKKTLAEEAEQLAADSTQWKAAGDRLREILEEWKTIKGVDRKTDAELWKRYAAARDSFNRRRGSHFATLDASRKQAQGHKEELVNKAEALSESTDWQTTAGELKTLAAEWKSLPRASREAEDQLWKRFRAAQDHFFTERSKVLADRNAEWRTNQKLKEDILAEAEAIDLSHGAKKAQVRLRALQAQWDKIGRVPREAGPTLDRRLRAVEDRVRGAVDSEWQRSSAATNPLLTQMREQVGKATQQLERAKASGDAARIAEAQQSLDSKQNLLDLAERSSS